MIRRAKCCWFDFRITFVVAAGSDQEIPWGWIVARPIMYCDDCNLFGLFNFLFVLEGRWRRWRRVLNIWPDDVGRWRHHRFGGVSILSHRYSLRPNFLLLFGPVLQSFSGRRFLWSFPHLRPKAHKKFGTNRSKKNERNQI